jgi:capsule polysaccharide export protein KpsE/RkpR
MRELLDQGAYVSKEFAAKAGEKAQDWSEKGYQVSKDFLSKAGAKAQDLGERGVLMLEIKQLEGQAQKLLGRLGNEVYTAFTERKETSFRADSPDLDPLLAELDRIKKEIEKREQELKNRGSSV